MSDKNELTDDIKSKMISNTSKNIIDKFTLLLKDYDKKEIIMKKIDRFIENDMPTMIDAWEKKEEEINAIHNFKKTYISNFLNDKNTQYYFCKNPTNNVIFYIEYDKINYNLVTFDNIRRKIIIDIQKKYSNHVFSNYKHDIAKEIIELIKNNDLFTCIPESNTIQNIINFLSPMFLKTKEEVKYFLTTIGDCIKNKNEDLVYYVPETSREFITELELYYKDYFGRDLYNHQYKFKYRGADYKNSRIIMFKKIISNKIIWKMFLKKYMMNFLVVSSHYSNRYTNSDTYILKQTPILIDNIYYLKNNDKSMIIDDFVYKMLNVSDNEKDTINIKNMYFLWKLFCDGKNIPIVIYKNDFIDMIKNKIKYDEEKQLYIGIKSDCLNPARKFNRFWNDEIEHDEYHDDEYELSEICDLFNIWLKNNDKNKNIIKEDSLKKLILYFYPKTEIKGKYIFNIQCKMWNKKRDIKNSLENKFNKKINTDITLLEAYKSYCSYGDKNNYINIVSKSYFEKYINDIIPFKYLKNNMILKEYWTKK